MKTLFEIKDKFLQSENEQSEQEIVDAITATGICGGLARELTNEWFKLRKKDLTEYPKHMEAKRRYLAKFMGAINKVNEKGIWEGSFSNITNCTSSSEDSNWKVLIFGWNPQSDWNHLMAVSKKCFEMIMKQNRPTVNHCSYLDWVENNISSSIREYSIEAAFEFAVDFVFYFNINNNQ